MAPLTIASSSVSTTNVSHRDRRRPSNTSVVEQRDTSSSSETRPASSPQRPSSPNIVARTILPHRRRRSSRATTSENVPSATDALPHRNRQQPHSIAHADFMRRTFEEQLAIVQSVLPTNSTTPFVHPREESQSHPSPTPAPSGLVSRITNAISTFSTAISPATENPSTFSTNPIHILLPALSRRIAILDSVSTEVNTDCSICLEPQRSMRRLGTCGHMFCADCLMSQLKSGMARKYDCALCRRCMFAFRCSDRS
ncbi:hypothetical protein NX059_001093 [Plenodomus lindquistii]|nr:hypothetical protein NX059_001093 [Plenodomus lindquistii]